MRKSLLVLPIFILLIIFCLPAYAAESMDYPGDGLLRSWDPVIDPRQSGSGLVPRNTISGSITKAWLVCDAHFLTIGKEATFTICLETSHPEAAYSYEYAIFYQPFGATTPKYYCKDSGSGTSSQFSVTFSEQNRYFIFVSLTDSLGSTAEFASTILQTKQSEDHDELADAVANIVATYTRPSMTDYEKAKALHDWLVHHAYYARGADIESYDSHKPEGVILRGVGVCESYALAYQLLLREAGIPCLYVTGSAGGGHAWNKVMINGQWYNVDATWDDPSGAETATSGSENYNYFMVPDEVLAIDHTWNIESEKIDISAFEPDADDDSLMDGLVINSLDDLSSKLQTPCVLT